MAQWVKDLALLQLWHKLQLWFRFSPWPRNFHMPWVQPLKKKKKRKKKKRKKANATVLWLRKTNRVYEA